MKVLNSKIILKYTFHIVVERFFTNDQSLQHFPKIILKCLQRFVVTSFFFFFLVFMEWWEKSEKNSVSSAFTDLQNSLYSYLATCLLYIKHSWYICCFAHFFLLIIKLIGQLINVTCSPEWQLTLMKKVVHRPGLAG